MKHVLTLILTGSLLLIAIPASATNAQNEYIRGFIATGKVAGSCSMHGLIEKFQTSRQVKGGDALLEQFMAFVAQRVQKTPEEYWQHCLDTNALLKRIQAQADALEGFTWPFDESIELNKS